MRGEERKKKEREKERTEAERMAPGEPSEGVMAASEVDSGDGVVWEELPAPEGWKKKVAQRRGGTPRRGDITFVAPGGEEFKTKRQLERYLKANPGGPPIADFDWSTGETPRRSERLSSRKRSTDGADAEPTTPKRGKRKSKTYTPTEKSAEDVGGDDLMEEPGKEEQELKKNEGADTEAEVAEGEPEKEAEEKTDPAEPEAAAAVTSTDEEKKEEEKSEDNKANGLEIEEPVGNKVTMKDVKQGEAAAISCAKTETLAKSQEAQPAQIGVSS